MKTIKLILVLIISLIKTLPHLKKAKRLQEQGQKEAFNALCKRISGAWGASLVKATGSTVTLIGEENIPKDQAVVIISNHQGNFDIPVLMGYFTEPVAFIAKNDLERIPIIGAWMKVLGCVFIKRGNPREALKAIHEGVEKVKAGRNMVIFPEGTRSIDGNLLPFKPGSLKLAMKSGALILPVTLVDTRKIMPKKSIWIHSAEIKIVIDKAIDPKKDSSIDLAEEIHQQIQNNLNMYQNQ